MSEISQKPKENIGYTGAGGTGSCEQSKSYEGKVGNISVIECLPRLLQQRAGDVAQW